jgi:hypothetical protein
MMCVHHILLSCLLTVHQAEADDMTDEEEEEEEEEPLH